MKMKMTCKRDVRCCRQSVEFTGHTACLQCIRQSLSVDFQPKVVFSANNTEMDGFANGHMIDWRCAVPLLIRVMKRRASVNCPEDTVVAVPIRVRQRVSQSEYSRQRDRSL